jgi:hypothetical protein
VWRDKTMNEEKKMFTTRINKVLLTRLKILGVEEDKPINKLIEEAIIDLLSKKGDIKEKQTRRK